MLGDILVRIGRARVDLPERPRQLLCRLLVADGRPVSAARLREDLWPEQTLGVVKTTMTRLRARLGSVRTCIEHSPAGYVLRRDLVNTDLDWFATGVDLAARQSNPVVALTQIDDVLQLWRGEPFGSAGGLPCLLPEVGRLVALRDRAVDLRARSLTSLDPGPAVVHALTVLYLDDPDRESLCASLATVLYRSGRQVEALRVVRDHQRRLREDLGLDSSAQLTGLEAQILNHDPALGSVSHRSAEPDAMSGRSLDVQARSIVGLAGSGALNEALALSRRVVASARSGAPSGALVRELSRQARVAALAGSTAEGLAALTEAMALARRADDAESLAHVALAQFAMGAGFVGDGSILADLAEPMAMLHRTAPLRLELVTALVHQIALGDEPGDAPAVVDEGLRLLDDSARTFAANPSRLLATASTLRGLGGHDVDPQAAHQLVAEATELGDDAVALAARLVLLRALMVNGELDEAERTLPELERAARTSLSPSAALRPLVARTAIAFARGELEGLEDRIRSTLAAGRRMGVQSAAGSAHLQLLALNIEREHFGLIADSIRPFRDSSPRPVTWDAVAAYVSAAAGDTDAATAALRDVVDQWSEQRPGGRHALLRAALVAEAAWWVDAPAAGQVSATLLDVHAGQWLVAGHSTALFGPVDRYRAHAALACGDTDRALALLGAAREQARAAGSLLWLAWAEADLAAVYLSRAGHDDQAAASFLVEDLADGAAVRASARLGTRVGHLVRSIQHGSRAVLV